MKLMLGQIAEWAGGTLVGDWNIEVNSIFADSRLCVTNSLFVGITGPTYDGNTFVHAAAKNGSVAALVSDEQYLKGAPGIICEDTIKALGNIAHQYRLTLDIPWVGLTGSNGKTTTRELLAHILRGRGPVVCSSRNYNNNIGVPFSILSAPEGAWAGVIEIGTNGYGEIAELAEILQPDIGIITSLGSTHLLGLGSEEGVANEKAALLSSLPDEGLAVFPLETRFHHLLSEHAHCKKSVFSLSDWGDITAGNLVCGEENITFRAWDTNFDVPLLGRHNAGNVLAAVAAADRLGVTPHESAERLKSFKKVSGRLNLQHFGPIRVIDDTYNANPDSLYAAVNLLMQIPAERRVAIVGIMGELGPESERLHRESGHMMARAGVDLILAMGRETVALAESASTTAAGCKVHYFPSVNAVFPRLAELIQPDDLVLVKGSRSAKAERVVSRLKQVFDKNDSQQD